MPETNPGNTFKVWTPVQKIVFRFIVLFFGLFMFPAPLNFLPFVDSLFSWVTNAWNALIVFTGKHILHLPKEITVLPNGSGDTTWNYVQIFLIFWIAVLGSIAWSLLDRKRTNYRKLLYWFNVAVRYYLGFCLISYGSVKVFKTQFPAPSLFRLLEPFGQSSPMGLAWTFLGYSNGYNYFMGAAEVIGGLLLFFRRTTTFGSLFCMTVTANIVAINLCFDVPVKIFSSFLLLLSVYLAVLQLNRLVQFFFLHKTVTLQTKGIQFTTRWKRVTLGIAKAAIILIVLTGFITDGIKGLKEYGDDAPKPALYGYYNVERFAKRADTLPPLLTDTVRWNKILFREYDRVTVKLMNDTLVSYTYAQDSAKQQFTIKQREDTTIKYVFSTSKKAGPDILELWTVNRPDTLYLRLRKINISEFPLLKRGFNWVNEYPYNK